MTHPQLAAMKARAEAAHPGPWEQGPPHNADTVNSKLGRRICEGCCRTDDPPNFAFIAHARTDLPKMIALAEAVMDECNDIICDRLIPYEARRRVEAILDIINRELAK